MTAPATPRDPLRRRRIGWVLPLVAAPVILFGGLLVAGVLDQAGVPELVWRAPWALAILGGGISIVVFLVELVRTLSGGGRLTPEERAAWDEYVRTNPVEEKPAGGLTGLLIASILLSVLSFGVAVVGVLTIAHGIGLLAEPPTSVTPTGSGWAYLLIAVVATPVFWGNYAKARRARTRWDAEHAHLPAPRPVAGRRHRTWVLPLLAIPLIVTAAVLIIIVLRSLDAPRDAIRAVSITMVFAIAVALVVVAVAVVRVLRTPPAPRAPRAPGLYERLGNADAEARGLTPEEYGVYKGDVGSVVQPVNSAGGLLFIAIFLTALNAFLLVLVGVLIAQSTGALPANPDDREISPVEWGFFVLELAFVPVAWRYYVVERRAQKLRIQRGLPTTLR